MDTKTAPPPIAEKRSEEWRLVVDGEVFRRGSLRPRIRLIRVRLIILRASLCIVIDGNVRHVPQQIFKMLLLLVSAARSLKHFVTPREIEAAFKGRKSNDIVRELRDFLEGVPTESDGVKSWVQTRRSPTGYFLALAVHEFDVRP